MDKIEKVNVQEIFDLSEIQKGMLYHYLRSGNENLYNVQLVLMELHAEYACRGKRRFKKGNKGLLFALLC